MKWLSNFPGTSIGRKQLMALTGLLLSIFLIFHLSGNFLLLAGDGGVKFNAYAQWLHDLGPLKTLGQVGLVALFGSHVFLAWTLTAQNRQARETDYFFKEPSDATLGSRTMIWSGVLVLIFLIIHLFNFTWSDASGPQGLYGVVVEKFTHPAWMLFYIFSMALLAFHLSHGIQSVFQTFGINHPTYTPHIKKLCLLLAIVLSVGFAFIPIWIMISKGVA